MHPTASQQVSHARLAVHHDSSRRVMPGVRRVRKVIAMASPIEQRAWVRRQLKYSLQALAACFEVQRDTYAPFACVTCELISDFGNFASTMLDAYATDLEPHQVDSLQSIGLLIDALPPTDTTCFTMEPLRTSSRWEGIRVAAKGALANFGWPASAPPKDVEESKGIWRQDDPTTE
jgi:hypothetical protein